MLKRILMFIAGISISVFLLVYSVNWEQFPIAFEFMGANITIWILGIAFVFLGLLATAFIISSLPSGIGNFFTGTVSKTINTVSNLKSK